ncbi:myotubularin-related protein 8-like [Diaphorina citri]|uniref:Myotubularin-related protein 8-like n=1 Tax=Diaphorina citri TaxID=121845 RepID=A0A3Q0ILP3_DIACI|nr:myotubularin-related protein 8-like [Diaphorina citri]XP_026687782.1 myotubularin-related protein 8-like [Diaphorina citri]
MHIASIERGPLSTLGSPLIIRCKTFLSVTFVIPRERECYDIYVTLQKLSRPVHIEELYCFTYTSTTESPKSYGWDFFSLEQEFKRMQVPNDEWCLTNLNKNYEVSLSTYYGVGHATAQTREVQGIRCFIAMI